MIYENKKKTSNGWEYKELKFDITSDDIPREININEAVIHVLDNNSGEPILNEYMLDLTEEIYMFLYKHIKRVLKEEALKFGKFNNENNPIKDTADEYLSGEIGLIDSSKEIARQMFSIMKSKGNISSCDLVVCSISTEYGPMLAILKMDYIQTFTHEIKFTNEELDINIMKNTVNLPKKLVQAALIKGSKVNYDLMILDKEKYKDESTAGYFTDRFLNIEILKSKKDITKDFIESTEHWIRSNLNDNADKAEKIRRDIKQSLKEDENIDIEKLSEDVFSDEGSRNHFIEFMNETGIEKTVPVDKEWVEKKLKKTRLKIDGDIDIYLSEEAYMDPSRFTIKRNGDGSIDMVIKHVRNYIEK